jgi:Methyltransferase domain
MTIGLGPLAPNDWLDRFMEIEGYERKRRLYHPVIQCWCGNSILEPLNHAPDAFRPYQLCTSCGCLLLKHVLPTSELGELYGIRYFREHQQAIGLPPFYERYDRDAHDRIPVWIRILQEHCLNGSILEIGCSHGRFLKELALLGYEVVGLELDEEISNWAKEKTKCDIRRMDINGLEDQKFDAIFANDVLEHVYDPKVFLEYAIGLLKGGGKVFLQTVIFDEWQFCPQNMLRPLFHPILYKDSSLKGLADGTCKHLSNRNSIFDCKIVIFGK